MSEGQSVEELIDQFQRRERAHEEACDRVEEAGEQRLRTLQEYYGELTGLFDRYESRIVSDGEGEVDMEAFIEYQEELAHFFEHLPEDLPHRADFEAVDDLMHERYLKHSDFEDAREALRPVADLVERLEERGRTRDRLDEARHDLERKRRALDERITEYERLVELGEADLDAPVERLREPIEAYNERVTEAFETFTREASAREVLAFVESTAAFPLVEYRQPPEDLLEYVRTAEAGAESIPQLLEYAEYSVSKLDHYVDNARALKRNVATHRTYLQRLGADPLTIEWAPPTAETLEFQCRELVSVVDRIDPPESVLAALRDVRALSRRGDYERLRESAIARKRLDSDERKRLKNGTVQDELKQLRDRRDRLASILED
ncbi:DUF7118 family protein [Halapricum hydrolyticum]|uniref:Uncharacterized protein n=1 Tax=Halapricum hydrolyticum TaxID=2979991 RepID=A0AAE3IA66_9EURY|nr:hypothetical protein [Halapricum hydrolyticum]MCU4717532.1 hypothetical protein [Halapricum hydrolyticum]MCU4726696.1 hypothetical protein [Halapricum hydrolyticum]